jgi:hypothetical protein
MATSFDRFASGISASQGTGEEQSMGIMPQRGPAGYKHRHFLLKGKRFNAVSAKIMQVIPRLQLERRDYV